MPASSSVLDQRPSVRAPGYTSYFGYVFSGGYRSAGWDR